MYRAAGKEDGTIKEYCRITLTWTAWSRARFWPRMARLAARTDIGESAVVVVIEMVAHA